MGKTAIFNTPKAAPSGKECIFVQTHTKIKFSQVCWCFMFISNGTLNGVTVMNAACLRVGDDTASFKELHLVFIDQRGITLSKMLPYWPEYKMAPLFKMYLLETAFSFVFTRDLLTLLQHTLHYVFLGTLVLCVSGATYCCGCIIDMSKSRTWI